MSESENDERLRELGSRIQNHSHAFIQFTGPVQHPERWNPSVCFYMSREEANVGRITVDTGNRGCGFYDLNPNYAPTEVFEVSELGNMLEAVDSFKEKLAEAVNTQGSRAS